MPVRHPVLAEDPAASATSRGIFTCRQLTGGTPIPPTGWCENPFLAGARILSRTPIRGNPFPRLRLSRVGTRWESCPSIDSPVCGSDCYAASRTLQGWTPPARPDHRDRPRVRSSHVDVAVHLRGHTRGDRRRAGHIGAPLPSWVVPFPSVSRNVRGYGMPHELVDRPKSANPSRSCQELLMRRCAPERLHGI